MKWRNLSRSAEHASGLMKSLANSNRLRILCLILEEERPVGEMAALLDLNPSVVSQHLALMRREKMVKAMRQGQTIYYQLADAKVKRTLALLNEMYCR